MCVNRAHRDLENENQHQNSIARCDDRLGKMEMLRCFAYFSRLHLMMSCWANNFCFDSKVLIGSSKL
jgi:hypothetical protein